MVLSPHTQAVISFDGLEVPPSLAPGVSGASPASSSGSPIPVRTVILGSQQQIANNQTPSTVAGAACGSSEAGAPFGGGRTGHSIGGSAAVPGASGRGAELTLVLRTPEDIEASSKHPVEDDTDLPKTKLRFRVSGRLLRGLFGRMDQPFSDSDMAEAFIFQGKRIPPYFE